MWWMWWWMICFYFFCSPCSWTNHVHFPLESRFELLISFSSSRRVFGSTTHLLCHFSCVIYTMHMNYGGMCRLRCHQPKGLISIMQIDWIRERNEKSPHHWWRRCSPKWKLNKYCINTNSFTYIRSCGRITGNFRFRFYVPTGEAFFLLSLSQAVGIGFKWMLHELFLGRMIYSLHNFMQLEA